ncbi:MAG TPA: hypothetical protein C5S37_03600 [Methanophagales archaeon]|nr:hypothetical protein [Methanophagales archaeon]
MNEEEVPYKCGCGGNLKKTKVKVEFFGIDFGLRDAEVCSACGSEYLNQETLKEIEKEIKERKIYKSLVQLFPVDKDRLEVKVVD